MPKKLKKYLLVDTSSFIKCCTAAEKKEDFEVLKALKTKMTSKRVTLLLPEIVQLEFERSSSVKREAIEEAFAKLEDTIRKEGGNTQGFGMIKSQVVVDDVSKAVVRLRKKHLKNFDEARDLVRALFKHGKTEVIPFSEKILLAAVKRGVAGRQPYNQKKHRKDSAIGNSPGPYINSDCLIIESALLFLGSVEDYRLFICSHNIGDFAEDLDGKKKDSTPQIHPDIGEGFADVRYYQFLFEFLNEEFDTKIDKKKLTISGSAKWMSPIVNSCEQCGRLMSGISVSSPSLAFNNARFCDNCNRGLTFTCQRCEKYYVGSALFGNDGFCDNCRASGGFWYDFNND